MIAIGSSQRIGNSTYGWNRKADLNALFPLSRMDFPQGRAILPQGWAFYLKAGLLFQTAIRKKSWMVMPAMGRGAKGGKIFQAMQDTMQDKSQSIESAAGSRGKKIEKRLAQASCAWPLNCIIFSGCPSDTALAICRLFWNS